MSPCHHIVDPAIRVLVQEQVIAELRRIADALERALLVSAPPARAGMGEAISEIVRVISVKQAAHECGCSEDTVERRFRQGKAGRKFNARIMFSRDEVDMMKRGEI